MGARRRAAAAAERAGAGLGDARSTRSSRARWASARGPLRDGRRGRGDAARRAPRAAPGRAPPAPARVRRPAAPPRRGRDLCSPPRASRSTSPCSRVLLVAAIALGAGRARRPARARRLRRGRAAQLQDPTPRAVRAGVSRCELHGSTPAELKARLEAERRGAPFLHYRDADGAQRIVELDAGGGRSPSAAGADNDVALGWDAEVSRVHAQLEPSAATGCSSTTACRATARSSTASASPGRRRLRDGDRLASARPSCASARRPAEESRSTAVVGLGRGAVTLTETQRRVLVALCRPLQDSAYATPATNREIADEIHLSVDAVKAHLRRAVRAVRDRRPAAEPEARAAGGGRAGRRAGAPARLLITLPGRWPRASSR